MYCGRFLEFVLVEAVCVVGPGAFFGSSPGESGPLSAQPSSGNAKCKINCKTLHRWHPRKSRNC